MKRTGEFINNAQDELTAMLSDWKDADWER